MHLVLVDDNEEFRTVTAQRLSRAGYIVRHVGDGRDALRVLREAPARLLLADITTSTDDRFDLMTQVQKQFPGMIIIAVSEAGPQAKLYLKIAGKLGAAATLLKPFSVDELSVAIARIELDRPTKSEPGRTS